MEGGGWVETVNSNRHCCWFSDKYDDEGEQEDQLRLWRVFQQARHLPGEYFFLYFPIKLMRIQTYVVKARHFQHQATSDPEIIWKFYKFLVEHADQMQIII